MDVHIVPIVKSKCGNTTGKNNCRPTALATVISKVLESVMLQRIMLNLSLPLLTNLVLNINTLLIGVSVANGNS